MGHGIAQVSAMGGHQVTLRDVESELVVNGLEQVRQNLEGGVERGKVTPEQRDATLERLEGTTDLAAAVADAELIIEAVPEDLDLKRDVFNDVEAQARSDAVLATNTSALSVTAIAAELDRPNRLLGLHFFNPVHLMDLVEVVLGERTAETIVSSAETYVESIEKTPIVVQDTPGFATSRLGVAIGVEAIRMVEADVATPRDIDRAMELGYNHPMGPIELSDVIGLDIRLDVLEHLTEELGERFRPPPILRRKVRAGKLGKKVEEGFYRWEDGEIVGLSGRETQ